MVNRKNVKSKNVPTIYLVKTQNFIWIKVKFSDAILFTFSCKDVDDKQFHAETQNINSQRDDGIIDESFLYPPLLVVDLF